MLTSPFAAGTGITAANLQFVAPLAAFKFADQNVGPSNTALVNDADLNLALAAGGVYAGFGMILYAASTVADYQATFAAISGATLKWSPGIYTGSGGSAFVQPAVPLAAGATIAAGGQGTAQDQWLSIQFSVVMGAVAGTLQWQAAQNSSDATNCNTRQGSYLLAWRVA